MSAKERKTLIVADAHVDEGALGKSEDFFEMLMFIGRAGHDVIFLGDVFELWIALPEYESDMHRRFIEWCSWAQRRHGVGFIEGNHEYYVSEERSSCFSWCDSEAKLLEGGLLFAHGDLINLNDGRYRLLRRLSRSRMAKALLKLFPKLGARIAERLRTGLKTTNMEHRRGMPKDMLELFAENAARNGAKRAVIGHFHERGVHVSASGVEVTYLPSWRDGGLVGVMDNASGRVEVRKWRELGT